MKPPLQWGESRVLNKERTPKTGHLHIDFLIVLDHLTVALRVQLNLGVNGQIGLFGLFGLVGLVGLVGHIGRLALKLINYPISCRISPTSPTSPTSPICPLTPRFNCTLALIHVHFLI